jgi:hypothetical protein
VGLIMSDEPDEGPAVGPTAWESLSAMWLYSVLRIAMFGVLWGLLWVARVPVFLAAVIALALSIPLSFVLLAKPRQRLATNLERRIQLRVNKAQNLDAKLSGDD